MQAFEATNFYFDQAAKLLDLTDNMRTLMVTPDRELRVEVVIEMDSGQIGNFIGYRVQHDNARGPVQGGLALSSPRRPGRGPVAGQPDDLEDRASSTFPSAAARGGSTATRASSRAASSSA